MLFPSVTVSDRRQSQEVASVAVNIDFQKHYTIFGQQSLWNFVKVANLDKLRHSLFKIVVTTAVSGGIVKFNM